MRKLLALACCLVASCQPAAAQQKAPRYLNPSNGAYMDAQGVFLVGTQESFQLVAANVPSAPATVYGGDYILSQTCTTYGTLNVQVLGPDGATWQTVLSKTASDTAGGSGFALGSYAQIRMTVSGTSGCNALVARVPA
jgi:hypothetical protein